MFPAELKSSFPHSQKRNEVKSDLVFAHRLTDREQIEEKVPGLLISYDIREKITFTLRKISSIPLVRITFLIWQYVFISFESSCDLCLLSFGDPRGGLRPEACLACCMILLSSCIVLYSVFASSQIILVAFYRVWSRKVFLLFTPICISQSNACTLKDRKRASSSHSTYAACLMLEHYACLS